MVEITFYNVLMSDALGDNSVNTCLSNNHFVKYLSFFQTLMILKVNSNFMFNLAHSDAIQ